MPVPKSPKDPDKPRRGQTITTGPALPTEPDPSQDSPEVSPQADSRLQVDAGPAFDAENRPAGDPAPEPTMLPVPDLLPEWQEGQVRLLLTAKGSALHAVLAVDSESEEWAYTEADLEAIAPPLTNILNRYEPTRAAAGAGDELAVAIGFGGYAARSWRERMAAIERLQAEREEQLIPLAGDWRPGDDEPAASVPDDDLPPAPLGGRRR
jgi:hypothetical protein